VRGISEEGREMRHEDLDRFHDITEEAQKR